MTEKTRKTIAVFAAIILYWMLRAPFQQAEAQQAMLQNPAAECAMDVKPHKGGISIRKPVLPFVELEPAFEKLDIALPVELQEHTWEMCQKYPTPLSDKEFYQLILRVMWHESRYIPDVADNLNRNGTLDRGLMQINSCNWKRLRQNYGLDVSDPQQNIEAGVLMLSNLLEEYPVEHALTAYALGEAGAANTGGSCEFSDTIMTMSMERCMETESQEL